MTEIFSWRAYNKEINCHYPPHKIQLEIPQSSNILTNAILSCTLSTANSIPPIHINQKAPPKPALTKEIVTITKHHIK